MAKNMARIENGYVTNIEWHSDHVADSDSLVSCNDIAVAIGDMYKEDGFYRNGEKIFTENEMLRMQLEDMTNALNILGVNTDG